MTSPCPRPTQVLAQRGVRPLLFLLGSALVTSNNAFAEPIEHDVLAKAYASDGTPLSGTYDVDIQLHSEHGVVYQDRFEDVQLTDGRYSVRLGAGAPLDEDATGTLYSTVGGVQQRPLANFDLTGSAGIIGALPPNTPPGGDVGGLLAPAAPGATATTPRGTADGLVGIGRNPNASRSSSGSSGSFGTPSGTMQLGRDPVIDGPLDRALIDQVVKRHSSALKYCYQREASNDPSLAGTVLMVFTIALDGTVSDATTARESTLANDAVTSCITGRFSRMRFPDPDGAAVQVTYPLAFAL